MSTYPMRLDVYSATSSGIRDLGKTKACEQHPNLGI